MADSNPGQGWYRLGSFSNAALDGRLREFLLSKFLSVKEYPLKNTPPLGGRLKFSEVYVRAYESIPRYLCPGGEFLCVGYLKKGETLTQNHLAEIERSYCQGNKGDIISVVLMPGPYFEPTPIAPSCYARNEDVESVIWARVCNSDKVFAVGQFTAVKVRS